MICIHLPAEKRELEFNLKMKKAFIIISTLIAQTGLGQLPESLEEVQVIGMRDETALQDIPRQVIVITREEIESSAAQSITEILEYAVGVDVRQRGPMDAQTDVSMRGGTFDQTLILIDGIRYSDPQTGHHQMNLPISHHQIERIEILPGGASRSLGMGAMTGAINIVTKKDKGVHGSGETFFGQNNLFGGRFYQQMGKENWGIGVHGQWMQHDGYIDNTDFQNASTNITGYYRGKTSELQGMLGFVDRSFGAQNFYSFAFPTQFESIRGYNAQLIYRQLISTKTKLRVQGYARQHHDRFELYREGPDFYQYRNGLFIRNGDTAASWYADHNYHRSRTGGLELNATHEISKNHRISLGADYRYEEILSSVLGEEMNTPIEVDNHSRGTYTRFGNRHNMAFYGEYHGTFHRFSLRGGALYNVNSDFGDAFMPGVELSFAANKRALLFAGANRSFRLPTYTDLYYSVGGAQGSQDLQPEYSDQLEVGYRGNSKRANWSGVVFFRKASDLIDWVIYPDDPTNIYATNINELDIYGLELTYNHRFGVGKPLERIGVSYSYQNSLQDDFSFQSVYALDFLRNKLNLGAMGKLGKIVYYNARVTWQDRRGDFDNALGETQAYPQVWLASLRTTLRFTSWELYAEGSNLFNQQPIYDRGGIILPGLWVRGGLVVKW